MRRIVVGLALVLSGCLPNSVLLTPMRYSGPVEEKTIYDADCCLCRNKVAIIDVDGMIVNTTVKGSMLGGGGGDNPMSLFREKLDAAAADRRVKAVVLRINSPGGAVTASDIMYRDLVRFRRETGKPVVACMMDVAASGAYYLAMGCDTVYAHPTTVTGSIGVIMSLYNAHGLMSMIGVKSEPIKSGPNKDIGNPGRPMTEEERAILQGVVNGFYDGFVKVVVDGRKMPEEKVRNLADGRIYTGLEAHKLGLVDHVGYLEDAIETAMCLACIKDAKIIVYDQGCGYRGTCYANLPQIPSEIHVKLDLPGVGPAGATFMYLWQPGVR